MLNGFQFISLFSSLQTSLCIFCAQKHFRNIQSQYSGLNDQWNVSIGWKIAPTESQMRVNFPWCIFGKDITRTTADSNGLLVCGFQQHSSQPRDAWEFWTSYNSLITFCSLNSSGILLLNADHISQPVSALLHRHPLFFQHDGWVKLIDCGNQQQVTDVHHRFCFEPHSSISIL